MNGLWPVKARKEHPVLGWLYTIHEKREGSGLVVWCNVSQEQIVEAMNAFARFKVHTLVDLGPFQRRSIMGRKWNFEKGTMHYRIEGNREGRDFAMDQEQLVERIREAEEKAA